MADHYAVLGVRPAASAAEIKVGRLALPCPLRLTVKFEPHRRRRRPPGTAQASYRALALRCHPDTAAGSAVSPAQFVRITEARLPPTGLRIVRAVALAPAARA